MQSLRISLFNQKSERVVFYSLLLFVFILHLSYRYALFLDFKEEEFLSCTAKVNNVYKKDDYNILKLKTEDFTFFTSVNKNLNVNKNDRIQTIIYTNKVSFIDFLKGFYSKNILAIKINTFHNGLYNFVKEQHKNEKLTMFYQALFFGSALDKEFRAFFTNYGLSHLIAISGFHLSVLSFCLYFLLSLVYSPFHQKYLLYRNKKFDILFLICFLLFLYVWFLDFLPSVLRAFIMLVWGLYLLRNNINVLSFETLLVTLLLILSMFPSYLFSYSLWFSIIGVFYIFLYIQYFKNMNKYISLLLFNFWIFAVFNPIIHTFFYNTSYEQFLSPFITLLFTLFYPLVLFLHVINQGDIFDGLLNTWFNTQVYNVDVSFSIIFLCGYVFLSLWSIFNRFAFYGLNVIMILFNFYCLYKLGGV